MPDDDSQPQQNQKQVALPHPQRSAFEMGFWVGGVNSLLHPASIPQNQYAWAENVFTRGGIPQTRPGFRFVSTITGANLQGMTIFTPSGGARPQMVVAVDGSIYTAQPPYTDFRKLAGIAFDPNAQIVTFADCLQSTQYNADGSLKIIQPLRVLVIQDGVTRAAYWDGVKARHLDPSFPASETPYGLWMAWANSRLWVARGSQVFASDLANPLTFRENIYLAERSNFQLQGDCTGLVQTVDMQGLLAFTESTTTAFISSIRDRTQWAATQGFQTLLLPSIGCVAGKSIVNQYGLTHWLTDRGLINLNAALSSRQTSQINTIDGEMTRSKRRFNGDASGTCAVSFENLLLVSVPAGSKHNTHTWIHDESPLGQAGNGAGTVWTGIWTGIRPVQWATARMGGRQRCFTASYGSTERDGSRIHIWEAFHASRQDNGHGRIPCQFETGMAKSPVKRKFCYAEIDVVEVMGPVSLQAYVGGSRGPWLEVLDTSFQAENGSPNAINQRAFNRSTILRNYKPQSRTVKTREFNPQGIECSAESHDIAGIDKGFSMLLQWKGRMGISSIRLVTTDTSQADQGRCEKPETGEHNIVLEDGETVIFV